MALSRINGPTTSPSEALPQPRLVANEAWGDRIVARIESSDGLRRLAGRASRMFSGVVKPGPIKDVLSGSAMGHPMHPVMTDVTIGAWTSAFFLDLLPSKEAHRAADTLIGIGVASALPTAVTGLSDLADTSGPARPLGGAHAVANTTATVLYGAAYLLRRRGRRGAGLLVSLAGATVATVGGFLGGHLTYRRGVGVDQTVFEDRIREWTPTVRESELQEDMPKMVRVGHNDVMVCRTNGRLVALADRCSHRGGPLHEGRVDNGAVECPWHGSTFRLVDGELLCGPATAPQPAYDTRVTEGMVEIRSR